MKKIRNNHQGFSVVEVVLVLVIVVLIGVVGWMVYKNHHKTTKTAITTSSTTKPATSTKTTTSTTPTVLSQSAVTQLATTFYNQYIACFSNGKGNLNQTCTTNLVDQYGTSNLYSYYKPSTGSYAEDPIMCAQDNPTSISVTGVTTTSTTASGTVVESFDTVTNDVKFTVISQSGNLKIDTVTCNPPLVASQQAP